MYVATFIVFGAQNVKNSLLFLRCGRVFFPVNTLILCFFVFSTRTQFEKYRILSAIFAVRFCVETVKIFFIVF